MAICLPLAFTRRPSARYNTRMAMYYPNRGSKKPRRGNAMNCHVKIRRPFHSSIILAFTFCLFPVTAFLLAQNDSTISDDVEISAADKTSERYWKILTQNPRSGTALDNWYRGYVDSGKLNVLLRRVEQHVTDAADDANAHILYGLVTQRQGKLDKALEAFNTGARLAPDNYYPCLLAGRTLTQLGRDAESSQALQRALHRLEKDQQRTPRTELLALYQQLGRAQVKCGQTGEAVRTWQTLGQLFPEDVRVQSQIAP